MDGDPLHDTPVPGRPALEFWGSDLIARTLRALDVPYVAHVPGSTYRGLHDSIVNHLGNRAPQLLLAIHEETAVAIAHGYAKVEGRMMATALHANVGLLRAPMAIYNAWCDRVPLLVLGATGPLDATRRRPTDWIHTSADQGSLVRDFTKWDDQPASPGAAVESLLRGAQIAKTAPRGPVYVNFDVGVQEEPLVAMPELPDAARYAEPSAVVPSSSSVATAAKWLSEAKRPLVLLGRCSRRSDDWKARVALAERLEATVLTHLRLPAAFPTDHRLHPLPPVLYPASEEAVAAVAEADVILSLDWPDLADTLKEAYGSEKVAAKVIRVSCDAHSHRGWSGDHRALPPADLYLMCETDAAVGRLLEVAVQQSSRPVAPVSRPPDPASPPLSLANLAGALRTATKGRDVCWTRLPLGWDGAYAHFRHPLDYIGYDGGSGIGSGPGITVGAALALLGKGRTPIAVLGDGDFLMGSTALWTAAHYEIPCLFVVCNNRSFHADELHQRRMAKERGRPRENQWIGSRIDHPDVDLAGMARSLGAVGLGPVTEGADLLPTLERGLAAVDAGQVCVIDVRVPREHPDAPQEDRSAWAGLREWLKEGLRARLRDRT